MDEHETPESGDLAPLNGVGSSGFAKAFGEPLEVVLDLTTWHSGTDLQGLYERLELDTHIGQALAQEDRAAAAIRSTILPELRDRSRPSAPPLGGFWPVDLSELEKIHRGTLFAGHVDACDSTVQVHESLALTIIQIGIALVGYHGDEGTWAHRLYRRDLQGSPVNAVELARQLLDLRDAHSPRGPDDARDQLTELGRRGITSYAERAVLTRLSGADWRMGRGSPAPYELLTGAGAMDLVLPSLDVLEELLTDHRRFIFVPSRGHRGLLTIGRALAPLEFAVIHKLRTYIEDMVNKGHLRGQRLRRAKEFVGNAGEAVAVGVFRASSQAPPYVFYGPAEEELCAQAASIALADAVIQEHRGYPMLLDMAKQFCTAAFGREEFLGPIQAAYAARNEPLPPET
ncbi:MAG: hypothetical protein QJR12_17230 [Mycobacterium sp.]|uniref:hypothetical protein n=1 Tax=Mycobacterium sp. TaxID=1785 RepID=UPI00263666C4|nr:hypothetical protein [Mycobacterium sp.]MDI3315944.1 hypothetical protein [Mycobacterium sp.]